jgi:hypothetical protein
VKLKIRPRNKYSLVQYNTVRTHQDGHKNFAVAVPPCGQKLQLNAELETSVHITAISNTSQMNGNSKAVPLHTVGTYREYRYSSTHS